MDNYLNPFRNIFYLIFTKFKFIVALNKEEKYNSEHSRHNACLMLMRYRFKF